MLTRISTTLLQGLVVLLGIAVLVFLLWEPHLEGVNANATTLWEIYFDDPFLAYAYLGSIPFFVGAYQAFALLGLLGEGRAFSAASAQALRTLKRCALLTAGLILGAAVFLVATHDGQEDIAGAISLTFLLTVTSLGVAGAAALLERKARKALGR